MNGIQIYANLVQLINKKLLACFFYNFFFSIYFCCCGGVHRVVLQLDVISGIVNEALTNALKHFIFSFILHDIGSSISYIERHAVSSNERRRTKRGREKHFSINFRFYHLVGNIYIGQKYHEYFKNNQFYTK